MLKSLIKNRKDKDKILNNTNYNIFLNKLHFLKTYRRKLKTAQKNTKSRKYPFKGTGFKEAEKIDLRMLRFMN